MKAENFFTGSERAEISAAISEVEKNTAGEIAVMVVDQSDTYPEGNILAGLTIGGFLALIITQLFFEDSLTYFMTFFAAFILCISWLANHLPALKRIFISRNRLTEMVREQAVQAFYEKELYRTRDATAVFFFISLFERKLWILADKGINSKISPDELQAYAGDMAQGIRQGRAAEVLCSEIGRLGEVLAEHFPARDDDTDELSNQVIV
jgi:putative membrane protein